MQKLEKIDEYLKMINMSGEVEQKRSQSKHKHLKNTIKNNSHHNKYISKKQKSHTSMESSQNSH